MLITNNYWFQVEEFHWTVGVCAQDESSCLDERYTMDNITEIVGVQLETLHPGSFDLAILHSLEYPSSEPMNCHELCHCLTCGEGICSDKEDQEKCQDQENTNGFICRCMNSAKFLQFGDVTRDMLATGMACRTCSN